MPGQNPPYDHMVPSNPAQSVSTPLSPKYQAEQTVGLEWTLWNIQFAKDKQVLWSLINRRVPKYQNIHTRCLFECVSNSTAQSGTVWSGTVWNGFSGLWCLAFISSQWILILSRKIKHNQKRKILEAFTDTSNNSLQGWNHLKSLRLRPRLSAEQTGVMEENRSWEENSE